MRRFLVVLWIALVNFCFYSCSGCNKNAATGKAKMNSEVSFKISGLDGRGEAEGNIKRTFLNTAGVVDCGIDYLRSSVVIKFDSNLVKTTALEELLLKLDEGKYKIIESSTAVPEAPMIKPDRSKDPNPQDPADYIDDSTLYDDHV